MSADADKDLDRLKKAAEALGEYFDSVQIFATRYESELEHGTVNCNYGVGNWFARFGQVVNWVEKEKERTRKEVRNEDQE